MAFAQRGLFGLMLSLAYMGLAYGQTSIENFYRGKTVTIIIGYGVGGSDDLWARVISRHISAYIPGQPNVVPQNVPGAGSLVAANQIYNTVPKDGSIFGLINRGVPFEALLEGNGVQFDPLQFNWIGSPDHDTIVGFVRSDIAIKSPLELRTKELIVAATGSGADSQTYPDVLHNLLGLKIKIVSGYPGSKDMNLAVERNEVQGTFISYDTAAREPSFANGSRRIMFQGSMKPDPRMPDVPTLAHLATDEGMQKALEFFLLRGDMGRPFVAPPHIPADRLAALQKAFELSLKDPALRDETQKQGLNVSYISPDSLKAVMSQAYQTDHATITRVRTALH
jgi:tripartite-type tricarboxylate transporter receptor subunit TctC